MTHQLHPNSGKALTGQSAHLAMAIKSIFIAISFLALPAILHAQLGNLLKRTKQTVISKTNNRIDEKVGQTVDKTLDKMEGKKTQQPSGTVSSSAQSGGKPDSSVSQTATGLSIYKKFDFKPGETIIYHNDFSGETLGESPIGWNSTGTASVVNIEGLDGKWVELSRDAFYLSDNKESFTENFTVEFDLLMRRNDPKAIFSQLGFGLMTYFVDTISHRRAINNYKGAFAAELKVQPYDYNGSGMHYQSFENFHTYLETEIKKYPELQTSINKPIHISMQVQGERLRIWFNQDKMYDLPQAILPNAKINQLFFFVKGNGTQRDVVGYDITNIRVAKGIADTRHKLIDEGKFSTAGILFAANSATIKPESFGLLKEIADVLKSNAVVRIKITGHTDSDGDDAANLELSKKRAEAIKEILASEFSIAPDRMETDGMGETKPVEKNNTPAGKARNRRVEFTRL